MPRQLASTAALFRINLPLHGPDADEADDSTEADGEDSGG